MHREQLAVDALIVGAGPAGLAAAIRLKQVAPALNVLLIEKGAEVGAHLLSGALLDPRPLDELIPDWQALDAPLDTPVTRDRLMLLSGSRAFPLSAGLLPGFLGNAGCYIISLGSFCQWLARQAEKLGVEILPGYAASRVLCDENGAVAGVLTGDMGIDRQGRPAANYQPGIELRARYTLFAEGGRGHLGKELEQRYGLRNGRQPQTYALGIKELWRVPAEQHEPGLALHSIGWPLDGQASGGGFCYHLRGESGECLVSAGLVCYPG